MNNKTEVNKSIKLKAYAIAYITLIPFGLYNAALCRLVYGFFGFNSKFIISFLVTILIGVAIIFLSIRNMEKKRNINLLRIIGFTIVMVYPVITLIAQVFSLFEFKGIVFDISKLSIFDDTAIFLNILLFLVILIVTAMFNKKVIK